VSLFIPYPSVDIYLQRETGYGEARPKGNYPAITLWLASAACQQPAINGDDMIEREHGASSEQQEILPCATAKLTNNIVHRAYLAGAVPVNHLGQLP
ncbi:hypothetical protein, partial [Marinobacter sp. UBA2498]